jgi:thiol:disulfide interchange protein DsbD
MFRKSFRPLLSTLLFLLLITISYPSFAQDAGEKNISVRLLPEQSQVKAGQTITVGIEQTIREGWHTYWTNPGDSGTAARVVWSGLDGLEPAAIQWPIPKHLPLGPLTNFGYEHKVVLLQDLALPKELPDGPFTLTATIDVLVCHEICIPESHTATLTLNDGRDPAKEAIEDARTFLPIDMGWATSMGEDQGDLVVTINTDTPSAFSKLDTIELYPEEWGLILNTVETRATKSGDTLTLRQKRGDRALSDVPVTKLVIVYEDANGERKGVRVSTLEAAAAGSVQDGSPVQWWNALLLAFLGGVLLNLMPCVFPVLSMKALSLVKLKDKEASIARVHGIAYTLGILATFTIIAAVLIALKTGGMQIGWGFQLQHPGVILFLAYLFFVLGLNLAGYFEIDFGLSNVGQTLSARSGLGGSFFTGMLATLVATPCTAPFMGAAMGYALTQPSYIAISIFLALGFGLALPYLALSFIPAVRHVLPKPGAWMETLRQFLSFPMFLSSCWLIWILSQQVSHMGQFAALLGMVAIAFSIWLWRRRPGHIAGHLLYLAVIVASLSFVASTFVTMHPVEKEVLREIEQSKNWEDYSQAALQEYLEGDDPVFVNMTAAWCITCKVNEKVALATESTQALFKTMNVHYLKGDWTNQNPEITAFLEEYGRSGVPLYVYYGPRLEKHGVRPAPVVLPQILTPGLVKNAIEPQGE